MKAILLVVLILPAAILCHGSHHSTSGQKPHKMHDSKMSQDMEHIKEHLKEQINIDKELTTAEMEFYYFLEHDFNNDTKLDGLEILAAIKHSDMAHEASSKTANLTGEALKIANAEELREYSELIDDILREDDMNKDGYISYIEYVFARRRAESIDPKAKDL